MTCLVIVLLEPCGNTGMGLSPLGTKPSLQTTTWHLLLQIYKGISSSLVLTLTVVSLHFHSAFSITQPLASSDWSWTPWNIIGWNGMQLYSSSSSKQRYCEIQDAGLHNLLRWDSCHHASSSPHKNIQKTHLPRHEKVEEGNVLQPNFGPNTWRLGTGQRPYWGTTGHYCLHCNCKKFISLLVSSSRSTSILSIQSNHSPLRPTAKREKASAKHAIDVRYWAIHNMAIVPLSMSTSD